MLRDAAKNIGIPCDKTAFCQRVYSELKSVQKLQGVAGELFGLLKGIVWIAHGAGTHNAGSDLAAKLVPQDRQAVFLCSNSVEILDLVAVAAAVAVYAAMTAAPIEVDIIVAAEPVGGLVFLQYRFCGYGFNNAPSPKLSIKNTLQRQNRQRANYRVTTSVYRQES